MIRASADLARRRSLSRINLIPPKTSVKRFPQQTTYAWYYSALDHLYWLTNQAGAEQGLYDEFVCAAPTGEEIFQSFVHAKVAFLVVLTAYRQTVELPRWIRGVYGGEDLDLFMCLAEADFASRVWLYLKQHGFL